MYKIQEIPDPEITMDNGSIVHPLVTLTNEHGGRSHIFEDDHCLVLCNKKHDQSDRFIMTHHWYREAVEAVRRFEGVWPFPRCFPGPSSAGTVQGG